VSNPDNSQQHENRIALKVEYDGANYCGWQRQLSPSIPTVQQQVESALGRVADHSVAVVCAGRTDSGVHATSQVVHFDCAIDRGRKAWVSGCNSLLPESIRIIDARVVGRSFHARFSATARRYNYVIQRRETAPAILSRRVLHVWQKLDVERMNVAAQALLGEQDFSAFRAAGCQSKSPFRNVSAVRVFSLGSFVVIDIQANAFVQHMVRNIVGALLVVGRGSKPADWIAQLLATRDRTQAAATAKPDGLYLAGVSYPEVFALSSSYTPPGFIEALA
jgi:tRNA pseudouridine38-40 synthase